MPPKAKKVLADKTGGTQSVSKIKPKEDENTVGKRIAKKSMDIAFDSIHESANDLVDGKVAPNPKAFAAHALKKAQEKINPDEIKQEMWDSYLKFNEDYMKKHNIPDTTSEKTKVYYNQMLLSCVQAGADEGFLAGVSAYAGMCLVDPEFRKDCQKKLAVGLYAGLDKLKPTKIPDIKPVRAFADALMKKANGGRMPMSAETAALEKLRLTKEARQEMLTEKGKTPEGRAKVIENYNKAVESLYEVANVGYPEGSGITREDIDAEVFRIVNESHHYATNEAIKSGQLGKSSSKAVDMMSWFAETDEQEAAVLNENGVYVNAVTGEPCNTTLTIREPESNEVVSKRIPELVANVYNSCKSVEQMKAIDYYLDGSNNYADGYNYRMKHQLALMKRDPQCSGLMDALNKLQSYRGKVMSDGHNPMDFDSYVRSCSHKYQSKIMDNNPDLFFQNEGVYSLTNEPLTFGDFVSRVNTIDKVIAGSVNSAHHQAEFVNNCVSPYMTHKINTLYSVCSSDTELEHVSNLISHSADFGDKGWSASLGDAKKYVSPDVLTAVDGFRSCCQGMVKQNGYSADTINAIINQGDQIGKANLFARKPEIPVKMLSGAADYSDFTARLDQINAIFKYGSKSDAFMEQFNKQYVSPILEMHDDWKSSPSAEPTQVKYVQSQPKQASVVDEYPELFDDMDMMDDSFENEDDSSMDFGD